MSIISIIIILIFTINELDGISRDREPYHLILNGQVNQNDFKDKKYGDFRYYPYTRVHQKEFGKKADLIEFTKYLHVDFYAKNIQDSEGQNI